MDPLSLRPLTPGLVRVIEPWFDDSETIAHLGGRDWIRRELRLVADMPGQAFRGMIVTGRWGWVGLDDDSAVGYVGPERYDDGSASFAFVVAPHQRRRGVGRAMLRAVASQPEVAGVTRFVGGVDRANVASLRCLESVGAELAENPDEEGMVRVSFPIQH